MLPDMVSRFGLVLFLTGTLVWFLTRTVREDEGITRVGVVMAISGALLWLLDKAFRMLYIAE